MPSSERQLQSLTALRGIAALLIVVWHYSGDFLPAIQPEKYTLLINKGALSVDLFFIMSGMILAHVYGEAFRTIPDWPAYRAFLRTRLARIYPLHFVTLAALVCIEVASLNVGDNRGSLSMEGRNSIAALIHNMLLTHSPWLSYRSWNFPSWSISSEWHAYLVFPLILPALMGTRRNGLILVAFACLATISGLSFFGDPRVTNTPAVFLRLFPEFVTGILLYRAFRSGCAKWLGRTLPSLIIVGGLLLSMHFGAPDLVIVLWMPLIVMVSLQNTGRLGSAFNNRAVVYLGTISYSIYMIHAVLLKVIDKAEWLSDRIGLPYPDRASLSLALSCIYLCAAVGLVVAFSAATYHLIEKPARALLRPATAVR